MAAARAGSSGPASLGGVEILSREEVEENLTLLLTSARSFGCTLGSLSVQDLLPGSTGGGEVSCRETHFGPLPDLHNLFHTPYLHLNILSTLFTAPLVLFGS